MPTRGGFGLVTAQDMFKKLEYERELLRTDPANAYAAFNFCVTGYHLLEWLLPDAPSKRKDLRDHFIPLQICEHIATGAKHFTADQNRHNTVAGTGVLSALPGEWKEGAWADVWQKKLVVLLEPVAANYFGIFGIKIEVLADEVLRIWTLLLDAAGDRHSARQPMPETASE